jgi:hypothetical protein
MKHNFLLITHGENAHFQNYTQECTLGSELVQPHWYLKFKTDENEHWKQTHIPFGKANLASPILSAADKSIQPRILCYLTTENVNIKFKFWHPYSTGLHEKITVTQPAEKTCLLCNLTICYCIHMNH